MAQRIKDAWGNEYERKTLMAVTRISGEPVIRLLTGAAVHCLDFFSSGMSYILTFRIIRKCLLGLSQRL